MFRKRCVCALPARDAKQGDGENDLSVDGDAERMRRFAGPGFSSFVMLKVLWSMVCSVLRTRERRSPTVFLRGICAEVPDPERGEARLARGEAWTEGEGVG